MSKLTPTSRAPLAIVAAIIATLTSWNTIGDELESWGRLGDDLVAGCNGAHPDGAQLVKRYFNLKSRADLEKKSFDKMPVSLLRNVIENERYYLLRDVFPDSLPETLNGKSVFVVCAIQFESLNLSIKHLGKSQEAQDDLKAWRYCVDDSYRAAVPEPLKKLQACYAKVVK